jgi:hypothetical protein
MKKQRIAHVALQYPSFELMFCWIGSIGFHLFFWCCRRACLLTAKICPNSEQCLAWNIKTPGTGCVNMCDDLKFLSVTALCCRLFAPLASSALRFASLASFERSRRACREPGGARFLFDLQS